MIERNKVYEEAIIQKGVRQGYNLSPTLFYFYTEEALKELREENIDGILVQMLRFAVDIVTLADSEENLKKMLLNFDKTLKQEYNVKTNTAKTKILVCSRQDTNIMINNITLEKL